MTNWLDKTASGPRLIAVIIANCFIVLWLIPWSLAHWMPGHANNLLDLKFAYSADDAAATIASFGDAARAGYRRFALSVDLIWPIGYGLQFAWIIALLKRKARHAMAACPFYPIITMFVLDLLENSTVALLVTIFPTQPEILGWAVSAFTTTKWLAFGATFIVIFWLSLVVISQGRSMKKPPP
ncbi:MAG: hypothetical protein AAB680_05000 [Pseudomonadota bacterium]